MLQQNLSLSELPRQIIRENINIDLEMLRHSILDVLIELSEAVEEADGVRSTILLGRLSPLHLASILPINCLLLDKLRRFLLLLGHILHEHEYLINPCDVFLNLSNIMLEHCTLDTLS
jgi:hypothetical protein